MKIWMKIMWHYSFFINLWHRLQEIWHEKSFDIIIIIIFKINLWHRLQEAKKARLEKFEIPAKIRLLSSPWTPESGLVTAALKIKRESIRTAFQDELSELYAS